MTSMLRECHNNDQASCRKAKPVTAGTNDQSMLRGTNNDHNNDQQRIAGCDESHTYHTDACAYRSMQP